MIGIFLYPLELHSDDRSLLADGLLRQETGRDYDDGDEEEDDRKGEDEDEDEDEDDEDDENEDRDQDGYSE